MLIQRFFLFFMLWITSAIYADALPYEKQRVEEILKEGQWIKLTNGSLWQVKVGCEEAQRWQVGDEIVLAVQTYYVCEQQYFFKNLRLDAFVEVQLNRTQRPNEESLYTIETFTQRRGYNLILHDQSVWNVEFSLLDTIPQWQSGDKIALVPALDAEEYYLINVDSSDYYIAYAHYFFNKEQNPYRHFIQDIAIDATSNRHLITLNNGFTWTSKGYADGRLTWQIGDEVRILGEYDDDDKIDMNLYIFLHNLRTLNYISVIYKKQQTEWVTHKIKKIEKLNHSFFSYELYLSLDDGSKWKVRDRGLSVQSWKEGDRLIISPFEDGLYTLINPDYGLQYSFWQSYYQDSCAYAKPLP